MKNLTVGVRIAVVFCFLALFSRSTNAQIIFLGTNQPGAAQDFALVVDSGTTNLAISIGGAQSAYSHLLLGAGSPVDDSDFDFSAAADGSANAINLELPELAPTNYLLRVRTPSNSLAHSFTVMVVSNVNDFRTVRPVTKSLVSQTDGSLGAGVWHYFRVDVPANLTGWRVVLDSSSTAPDLYVQRDQVPTSVNWLKRSQGQTNDLIAFTPDELLPGPYFIGVFQQSGSAVYTLRTEVISFTTLVWDPGLTHAGTQVHTNQEPAGGDFYFRITTQNTSLNAWRTALHVLAGEASLYLAKGSPPGLSSNQFKSTRPGSDGFVVSSTAFNAGEDWYFMVRAEPGSQWTLLSGEPFVTDLGTVAADASSGSGSVAVGPEGLRFFKTTVPADTLAWRLYLNGQTNFILVKKTSVPIPGNTELSQARQMLVVPTYLAGGQQYFVGVPGFPGEIINLDSRQQTFTDIPFLTNTNLSVTGFGYTVFRIQVPVDQIAWQVSVIPTSGNPNLAARRNQVPNELNNEAYSEVPGGVIDSILLVPPTLSDGTFYITVYGTNDYSCTLQSGNPEVTEINFTSTTENTDTNRVGWRLFKVSDIGQQLGALGWDLLLTNATPGTRIALRRNAAPGIWNYRNPIPGTAGIHDFLSAGSFLQRPGHQADVWYVGVYNPTNALGNFSLITRELGAESISLDGGSAVRSAVPAGKWEFFRIDVPSDVEGWDVRVTDVLAGSPRLVVRREALPISLTGIGFVGTVTSTNWPTGNQWVAGSDWTGRNFSADGLSDESGRILTMGYGRPLEAGTYYVGVISPTGSTNEMSYTLLSRAIGSGRTIPVQDIDYIGSATNIALPARDIAVYRVEIPSNAPSWKVRLSVNSGDAMLAVARQSIPNITAAIGGSVTNTLTAGRRMTRIGNEHFVQLPPANQINLVPGSYYLLVAGEGVIDPTNSTRIGTGNSDYVLESVGPMPEIDLGLLGETDLVYPGQLEGGESIAFHFQNDPYPTTLGFELSLEDEVGNPVMVSRGTTALANPGAPSSGGGGVPADPYGNEGGQANGLQASGGLITVSGAFTEETVMVKARSSAGGYPDASYTLRVRKLVPTSLDFDSGAVVVSNQPYIYEFFQVEVPPDAAGWDLRITNVIGEPQIAICRDFLALHITTPTWNPKTATAWPSGATWIAAQDWTARSLSSDGTIREDGRILAMGMGQPLQPGTYYIGVRSTNAVSASYTIVSRGIGDGYSIPVVDLPFSGGSITNLSLAPREAAYYRVLVPTNAASWQARLQTVSGDALLLNLTNSIPHVLTGRAGSLGKVVQKPGDEQYVLLAANNQTSLRPGTNFVAVVGEGMVTVSSRIGTGESSYILESRGALQPIDLGTISDVEITHSGSLDGGEVRAYQFTVPAGTLSLETQLRDVTGNPAMVLRVDSLLPNPGAASTAIGAGSVTLDVYGNEGGQNLTAATGNANTNLITIANPTNGIYTLMVKARTSGMGHSNATYTLAVRAIGHTTVAFDGGSSIITNHLAATWRYFRVDVPPGALGWDVRLVNVSSGLPRMVVRRDLLPGSLTVPTWSNPGINTTWPSGNQWSTGPDWTRRANSADGLIVEDGRILAMGMGQPLEPGAYYIGVINSTGTNVMNYTILSRGIGDGLGLPVTDLNYNGGTITNENLAAREAAYYRVSVPPNGPGWKLRLAPTVGEAMLLVLKDRPPNIDSGRITSPLSGRFMQKAGNEHYTVLPPAGQSNFAGGTYYLAVVSEGVNPASATRIGSGASSYALSSIGDVPVVSLGTVLSTDIVISNTLEGGESQVSQFTVPPDVRAVELRLENRVGNPVLVLSSNTFLPDPGGVLSGTRDAYGNDGGTNVININSNIITIANTLPGTYGIAVKARAVGTAYPDASYTLRVRQIPVPELNFTAQFNTNGLSNVGSGLLLDGQRAYYKVVVPPDVWGQPVIGWDLDLSQLSGIAAVRVRQDMLPADAFTTGMPFTPGAAVIAPPFLTNGTWYIEVRGTNSTEYIVTSSSLALQRPAWVMPAPGEPTTTPGLAAPEFADSGIDTNGVPLPGDQGIDLEQGNYHHYAVVVPTNNGGLMRVQMDAISGNADLYLRAGNVPTSSHKTNGASGTIIDRAVTGLVTEYANWVPLKGQTETNLIPGTWYLAVRAVTNANARYRLRLSTGYVQNLDLNGGSVTNQLVAGGDWRYFRFQIPSEPPPNWHVTFSQQSGDVVMHLRDTVPPGNGATTAASEYKDWSSDQKNSGPYGNFDLPGAYTFTVPPLRPGATYYLGFRGKNDSTFAVSSSTSGETNLPLPIIEFYGGSVTNIIPSGGLVAYRILTPDDAFRWRHTSTHSNTVQVYLENGTLPTRTPTDDFRSTVANSTLDRFLTVYPWLPNQTYYLVATNTSPVPQYFSLTMNGRSTSVDDDADGMADSWEYQYFGTLSHLPNTDIDSDGVSNLNEYLEGTIPNDRTSFNPRLTILATNGIVSVEPAGAYYAMGAAVALTPAPDAGYAFLDWSGAASGTANPLDLIMTTNLTVIPRFRVPGDDFDQRIPLSGASTGSSGLSNAGATRESGEPDHAGNAATRSLWWTWTAPLSGTVTLSTEGTDFPNALAVYTGSSVSNLTAVASDLPGALTNTSSLTFNAESGITYHFAVDGYNGATGAVTLAVTVGEGIVLSEPMRLTNGLFRFTITSAPGQVLRIDATTDLMFWIPIATITNVSGTIEFVDPDSASFGLRFYRAVPVDTSVVEWLALADPIRLPNGAFRFTLTGTPGKVVHVEAGTNLIYWFTVWTTTNSTGTVEFTDPDASNFSHRFYRGVSP